MIIGASVSEPYLVSSTGAVSVYIYVCLTPNVRHAVYVHAPILTQELGNYVLPHLHNGNQVLPTAQNVERCST